LHPLWGLTPYHHLRPEPRRSRSVSFGLIGTYTADQAAIYISIALLDVLADTPKNRAFIAKVRPVVERCNHIGIRIEDDYLITPTGVEWLSKAPREIKEIEAVMQAAAKNRRGGS
jgi:hypothetical protein